MSIRARRNKLPQEAKAKRKKKEKTEAEEKISQDMLTEDIFHVVSSF